MKNKKKYWIKDLNSFQGIHAPTKEIADNLCRKFVELGLTWVDNRCYCDNTGWGVFKANTVYYPYLGTYDHLEDCKGELIISINDLHDFNEPIKNGDKIKYSNSGEIWYDAIYIGQSGWTTKPHVIRTLNDSYMDCTYVKKEKVKTHTLKELEDIVGYKIKLVADGKR